jgi:hypothetical protein
MRASIVLLPLIGALLLTSGCEKEHTHDHSEHDIPARFVLRLVNQTDTATAIWSDLDGPGGNAPQITPLSVRPGTYQATLDIFTADGDTLTNVIYQQGTEHQLFYTVSTELSNVLTIEVTDRDARGMPIGLRTVWTVGNVNVSTTGSVRMRLYHYEPNKKDGQSPSPETDADISIPVTVTP